MFRPKLMANLMIVLLSAALLAACASDLKTADHAYSNKDFETARLHYEDLAKKGFPEAQVVLGRMYLYGKGMERNPEKALELFKAADRPNGDRRAKNYIPRARAYIGRKAIKGKTKNYTPEQGLAMLEEVAETGNKTALFELGYAYEKGLAGLKPDGRKAAEYYGRSADTGYSRAFHYQGELYEDGELIEQDPELAARLYEKAVEKGYSRSAKYLAKMYEEGRGVPRNVEKAMHYYNIAEENGHSTEKEIAQLRKSMQN